MKLAITSVYANPLHPGHVECFDLSKEIADELWVIVKKELQKYVGLVTKRAKTRSTYHNVTV